MKHIILHIPHSSTVIPKEVLGQFVLSKKELDKELLKMTDHYTDEQFNVKNSYKIKFPISRLVLDPERFIDDSLEPMSKIGMGVVYTKTSGLKLLRNKLLENQKQILINTYYKPHHSKLSKACEQILNKNKKCIIIDCHSFPKIALPYELAILKEQYRPEICIGTDSYHTNKEFESKVCKLFKDLGYNVSINTPFVGSLVPMKFYKKNKKVQSLMIEIRRDLYMDELTGQKSKNFEKVKSDIAKVLNSL